MNSKADHTLAKRRIKGFSMTKLHLGCGWRDFGDDWIHIDGGDYDHLDHHDITDLPQSSNSCDLIYASHVLEYFDREEAVSVLQEWIRVLKPGGVLRIAVPDFEAMASLYFMPTGTSGLGNPPQKLSQFLGPLYGKMQMGDDTIYHKTVYDFEELSELLESQGLKDVKRYEWRNTEHAKFDDHSQAYIPHMEKDTGVLISLNVEGVKE